MKRFLLLSACFLSLSIMSCTSSTWVCDCGNATSGFEEKGRYDNKKEAESGCYTTEVNLQLDDPTINCLVSEE
jgi:hypothetical protein